MAKAFKCKMVPKGQTAAKAQSGAKAEGDLFSINDLGSGKLSVTGHDANGVGGIDLSGIATLTATSSDPSVLTVDAPVGMTAQCKAVKAGRVTISLVATWNDGSIGPFAIDVTAEVVARTAAGLDVVFTAAVPA